MISSRDKSPRTRLRYFVAGPLPRQDYPERSRRARKKEPGNIGDLYNVIAQKGEQFYAALRSVRRPHQLSKMNARSASD